MDKEQSKAEGRRHKGRKTMVNRQSKIVNFFMVLFLLFPFSALAGSLDSPAAPTDSGSAMYTLSDIYNRLNAGTAGSKRSGAFTEPSAGPAATGKTLDDVMGKAPSVDDTDGASASEVLSGKTYWGLTSGAWGTKTGTLATQTLSDTSTTVSAGNYAATTLDAVDSDLATGNIKSGVTIFGIAGTTNVVDTTTGDAVATEIANGKKAWVDGSEITGSLYAGVTCTGTLNGTRWCNNGDGTVTDLTTGLMWLQEADWGTQIAFWVTPSTGVNAHDRAALVKNGTPASLTDGSVEGDWRLPTLKELKALTASGTEDVFSGTMRSFTGVQAGDYWSSTTYSADTTDAWDVNLGSGNVGNASKTDTYYVWPVRGGQ